MNLFSTRTLCFAFLAFASAGVASGQTYLITTIAGGALPATAIRGVDSGLAQPDSLAVDTAGSLYFSVPSANAVFKLDTQGMLTRVAGNGKAGYSGDGGFALRAQLSGPTGIAIDAEGNLYIADPGNERIRRVDRIGIITTVAGNGYCGNSGGDGGPAPSAQVCNPWGMAMDGAGNLYFADGANRIRRISREGTITTVAGSGRQGFSGDGGPATSAMLSGANRVAVDPAGNLYIADGYNRRVRKVAAGIITTVAGGGTSGQPGDGGPAVNATLMQPNGLSVDGSGNLYIVDSQNHRVRKVDSRGIITTVAGNAWLFYGFSGDGGTATEATLRDPADIAVDAGGNLYISDAGNRRIRKVTSGGAIRTVAGGATGDVGPAVFAHLDYPSGMARDSAGNLYISERNGHRVRKISTDGTITTVAGNGTSGFSGDGGPAVNAQLRFPEGVAVDSSGNLYVADHLNFRVRKVGTNGVITTLAGKGGWQTSGDGGPATNADLAYPTGVAVDSAGNVYIAEYNGRRVRKVSTTGTITTVAGNGTDGFSGDGGPGTKAQLAPIDLAVDGAGNLFIADSYRVRRLSPQGIITTVAGNGNGYSSGDGGPATSAGMTPSGLALDSAGNLYITDRGYVRVVRTDGIVTRIAGNGGPRYAGDGLPAGKTGGAPARGNVAVDGAGNIYAADPDNDAVRLIVPAGSPALLTIACAHSRPFLPGQPDAGYSITVRNAPLAGPTRGTVTVTEMLPAGLSLVSLAGPGWSCGGNTCTRSDSLAAGASYPEIQVTAGVATSAPGQVMNRVTVSGGGSATAGASDLTIVAPLTAPVLLSPSNGAQGLRGGESLTFTPSVAAVAYDIYFGTAQPPPLRVSDTAETTYMPYFGGYSTTYYWQVVAKNGTARAASPVWSFTSAASGSCTDARLSLATAGAPASGGRGSVGLDIPQGCPWTASTPDSWLTLPSGGMGRGYGDVSYNVAPNSGPRRTGTLTIAGRTLTVTQSAAGGAAGPYLITTIAGNLKLPATPAPGTSVSISGDEEYHSNGLALDASGNLYFSSPRHQAVFRLDPSGLVTQVAGNGSWGYSGDGGPATAAQLRHPQGVAAAADGSLYIADSDNHAIRRVGPDGIITTVAGNGIDGYSGDGGQATGAQLSLPQDVAVDSSGNLYIADTSNGRVRKVGADKVISTVAGNSGMDYSGDGGPATGAQLSPSGLAVGPDGSLYIADRYNSVVRRVAPDGIITTVAGNGSDGYSGDGGPAASAELSRPEDVFVDAAGNVFIADHYNYCVRKVSPDGLITTVAGNGSGGFSGDGGAAAGARLNRTSGVAGDAAGNLYIADWFNTRVRKINPAGIISTVVGGATGDAGLAVFAGLSFTAGLATDSAGNLYIADSSGDRVRKVAPDGAITTLAGNGAPGYSGDGGPAVAAQLNYPTDVAPDGAGNLYISTGDERVRKIDVRGNISTVAGTGVTGFGGDGGPATSAQLEVPASVAVGRGGDLYIADRNNQRIRRVNQAGIIATVAGGAGFGYSGDNGPAVNASLNNPLSVALDSGENLYIADSGNNRIRKVSAAGIITTYAGNGSYGFSGDGGPAAAAQLGYPYSLDLDAADNLYLADASNLRVRKVANGTISTIAGGQDRDAVFGDGAPATSVPVTPISLAADRTDYIYLFDGAPVSAVRVLVPAGRRPVLTIQASHSGNFYAAQKGATFSLSVRNAEGARATNGPVTVTEILPAGLTLVSMTGSGWSCSANACTRSDSLAGGAAYPPITVAADVAPMAAPLLTNRVTASGGEAFTAGSTDYVVVTPSAQSLPSVSAVVNGASFGPGIADGAWITITGSNLAASARGWRNDEIVNGKLPTSLDGVTVTFDGLPAAISYISPTQLNVQVPATGKTGPVSVVVTGSGGASAPVAAEVRRNAPGLFIFYPQDGRYPAALIARAGGVDYLGPAGLFGSALVTRPARPGEVILLYATGLGPTDPPVPAGEVFSGAASVVDRVTVTIGGVNAPVAFAGLAGAGLYQINVIVPNVPAGDQPLAVAVSGVPSQSGLFVPVQP